MTDEEYNKIGEELVEMFGDELPDPQQEPKRFEFYVKLYKYERWLNEQRNNEAAAKQEDSTEGNVCETPVEDSESTPVPGTEIPDTP